MANICQQDVKTFFSSFFPFGKFKASDVLFTNNNHFQSPKTLYGTFFG